GRSYVYDGKSNLKDFRVNNLLVGTEGSEVKLNQPGTVRVTAKVAALLNEQQNLMIRLRNYQYQPYWDIERARIIGSSREVPVEVIVNGVPVERSSWVALRILPSSHTNPLFITVGDKPIRASKRSAEWCLKSVDQCWSQKSRRISAKEREEAEKAYEHARQAYSRILAESEAN